MDNVATGKLSIWSSGEVGISYSTSYVGCKAGAGAYALHIVAEKLQSLPLPQEFRDNLSISL